MSRPEHAQPPLHTPLTPEERSLAETLASLPDGAPSPATDARVLEAARRTGRPAARRRAPWAGLATAAVAVLAISVFWRMQDEAAPASSTFAESAAPPPPPSIPASAARETLRRAITADTDGAAATEAAAPRPHARSLVPPAPAANTLEPDPDALRVPSPATPAAEARATTAAVPPPAGAPRPPAAPARAALPPPALDARLAPIDWIARIRTRLADGDRAGATESLRLFHARHPEIALPDDLEPLLR
ncbi:hypothetical protein [Coralloluteibacterium stylophorae]|uniref:Uncharacterized protein n=2 Tax=Coralloluteibacterium stylophorae TaxID=1776034 RepID=A0AAP2C832_9GAMM|nr:hypothetical protein [Coralloluteibacterium stylophorae]MBS7455644.1 hypothetical protein [Coralloluteibacterium stylophorae]